MFSCITTTGLACAQGQHCRRVGGMVGPRAFANVLGFASLPQAGSPR